MLRAKPRVCIPCPKAGNKIVSEKDIGSAWMLDKVTYNAPSPPGGGKISKQTKFALDKFCAGKIWWIFSMAHKEIH
jgi:hypothetical protein